MFLLGRYICSRSRLLVARSADVVAKFASWAEESFGEAAMDVDGKRTKSAPTGPLDPYKVRNQKIAAAKEKKLAKRKAKKEKQQKQKVDATRANDGLGPSRLSTPGARHDAGLCSKAGELAFDREFDTN